MRKNNKVEMLQMSSLKSRVVDSMNLSSIFNYEGWIKSLDIKHFKKRKKN